MGVLLFSLFILDLQQKVEMIVGITLSLCSSILQEFVAIMNPRSVSRYKVTCLAAVKCSAAWIYGLGQVPGITSQILHTIIIIEL